MMPALLWETARHRAAQRPGCQCDWQL